MSEPTKHGRFSPEIVEQIDHIERHVERDPIAAGIGAVMMAGFLAPRLAAAEREHVERIAELEKLLAVQIEVRKMSDALADEHLIAREAAERERDEARRMLADAEEAIRKYDRAIRSLHDDNAPLYAMDLRRLPAVRRATKEAK